MLPMIELIFRWLENRSDPFPSSSGETPPSFFGFIIHYTQPFWPLILAGASFGIQELIEVYLFSFIGDLVDLLEGADQDQFQG